MWRTKYLLIAQTAWTFWILLSDADAIDNDTISNVTNTLRAERNSTNTDRRGFIPAGFSVNGSMIQRTLYVVTGITVIGLLYFLVRAVRVKKTSTRRKKYGLLSNYDDNMELAHLESDEEDMTVYEAKALRR
ncbi:protein FAM174C [Brienomyrus brachyistius]|uniref:protein FAM174C n=1 Tax=Brienomyrus brachyistius TaxID=42636 RepID=UPI0020B3199A|nr:protein FAM174C [Brienomyrus brachyistius]